MRRTTSRRNVRFVLAIVATGLGLSAQPAAALDKDAPIQVNVTVTEVDGKAVHGAKVEYVRYQAQWGPANVVDSAKTDAAGKAALTIKGYFPSQYFAPDTYLRVQADGFFPYLTALQVFPSAVIRQDIRIAKSKRTILHLRSSQGKPLAHQPLLVTPVPYAMTYWLTGSTRVTTDAAGDATVVHPSLEKATIGLGMTGIEVAIEPDVTVKLTAAQERGLVLPGRLEGKLLDLEGKPAAGWFVSSQKYETGYYWPYSAYRIDPGFVKTLWQKVGGDGTFRLDACYDELWVVSPEGVPLLYPLSPGNWPQGGRKITLQVPPLRRTHHVQVKWEKGGPLAGTPFAAPVQVPPLRLYQYLNSWSFRAPLDNLEGLPAISTDNEGGANLPVYFGVKNWWSLREVYNSTSMPDFLRGPEVRVWPYPTDPMANVELKLITVAVSDESGNAVVGGGSELDYNAGLQLYRWVQDSRGRHIIIPKSCESLKLRAWAPGYKENVSTTVKLSEGDQTETVQMSDRLRRKIENRTLTARLVDSQGKGVADAEFSLGYPYTALLHTDGEGRFSAQVDIVEGKLPRLGNLKLKMWGCTFGYPVYLGSGFVELEATPGEGKETTYRLPPMAGLKVLYPAGIDPNMSLNLAFSMKHPQVDQNVPAPATWGMGGAEEGSRILLLPAGKVTLQKMDDRVYHPAYQDFGAPTLDIETTELDLKAGELNVLDLRKAKFSSLVLLKGTTTIQVLSDGKPASGASVHLYATAAVQTEELLAAVRDLGADKYKNREAAQEKLTKAGITGLAVALQAADRSDAEVVARLEVLRQKLSHYGQAMISLEQADLSDDDGKAPMSIQVGRRYVVVARQAGKAVGRASFVAADKDTIKVELKPVSSLEIQDPQMGRQLGSSSWRAITRIRVTLPTLTADETYAVLSSLGLRTSPEPMIGAPRPSGSETGTPQDLPAIPPAWANFDAEDIYLIEDLPQGMRVRLEWWDGNKIADKTVDIKQGQTAVQTKLE